RWHAAPRSVWQRLVAGTARSGLVGCVLSLLLHGRIRNRPARVGAHRLRAGIAAAVTLVTFTACGRRETPVDTALETQTLHVALEAEPRDLDPQVQVAFSDMHVSLALFEGLTAVDEATS